MKLTDNEKHEILKLIEAEKPLPDKYRFLLFDDKREVELVWNGKTNEVTNIVLPFQVIEQIDEPRAEKPADTGAQGDLFDFRGRQKSGWTNKLTWGDNKLILSSLKNGPIREEIEKQGRWFDRLTNRNIYEKTECTRRTGLPRYLGQGRGQLHCHDLRTPDVDAGFAGGGRKHLCAL